MTFSEVQWVSARDSPKQVSVEGEFQFLPKDERKKERTKGQLTTQNMKK